ncbi:laccase domain protein [Allostella vacuolata]|nr:laccase domain protein [Stella vacuolata]
MITAPALAALPGIRHAFFTREGGVSGGIYAGLNCGFGSGDEASSVAENRARAMRRLDLPAEALATLHQVHSPTAVAAEAAWPRGTAPRADAVVTATPGLAAGILTADCTPVLFADADARIVGAAHAGWRGALYGVLDSTIAAMEERGAARGRIVAAVGPCIGPASYEVGAEFRDRFLAVEAGFDAFFTPGARPGKFQFDLPGFVAMRLDRAGLGRVDRCDADTAADPDRFFSYRRATLRGEPDYGRALSAIALVD